MTASPNLGGSVKVLIVDDQRLMRDGLATLLALQAGLTVVGTAADGQEALAQAQAVEPDVILMDVRMPVMDGISATAAVRQRFPDCQVLMLTTFDDDDLIVDALGAGAAGYLLKSMPAPDVAQAIIAAHRRIHQLDPQVAQKLVRVLTTRAHARGPEPGPPPAPDVDLSSREIDVARLVAQGATNREIATTLFISEGTVKNHISNMLSRLDLRDRVQIAMYARDHGLLA